MITKCKQCGKLIVKEAERADLCLFCLIRIDKSKFHPILEKEIKQMYKRFEKENAKHKSATS